MLDMCCAMSHVSFITLFFFFCFYFVLCSLVHEKCLVNTIQEYEEKSIFSFYVYDQTKHRKNTNVENFYIK